MAEQLASIDITDSPDLLRIAEEVRASNRPRVLRRANEDIAMIVPLASQRRGHRRRTRTQEDIDAFLSSAGSWKGIVDADQLIEDIYASRRIPSRPPPEL